MPADVASCSRTPPFLQKEVDYGYHTSPEMMSGYMTLSAPGRHRQPVHVKVYRTSLEHFAVVSPQKKICRPLGVLNLKNTLLEQLPAESKQTGFMVRQKGFDSPTCLTFLPETPMDLEDWIVAFTCRSSPTLHQSSLPIVEEDEEVWTGICWYVDLNSPDRIWRHRSWQKTLFVELSSHVNNKFRYFWGWNPQKSTMYKFIIDSPGF